MRNFFLSCDWGTSAFRLRLVRVHDHRVLEEVVSKEGMAGVFGRWKEQSGPQQVGREEYSFRILQNHINELGKKSTLPLEDMPVVISGMASSSIGIRELPYASLPFTLNGQDALVQIIEKSENSFPEVMLISGLKAGKDVMRGEETQMIGLAGFHNPDPKKEMICLFPGTHSKHLRIKHGKIMDFRTYMTGELFDLLVNQSLLKESVSPAGSMSPEHIAAFTLGIRRAVESNLLHDLFSVRVNQLFQVWTKTENYYYLSGLLIGSELKDLVESGAERIELCSGSNLYPLYRLGLEKLNLTGKSSFIPPEIMDKAVVEGQIKIFQQYDSR
jgi:2-dehydro-3-deoxygalactonokinase